MSIESLPDTEQWLWSDGELATASGAGCQQALSEIYRRYYARLVRVCHVRVHDRQLAEDIAQTTMLRAIRYLPSFEADRPLWPWLRVIALRQCATDEHKRSREVRLEDQDDVFDPLGDPSDLLLESLSLQRALSALPERQRMALELRYLEDVGSDEAATIIGVNRNAFDQLLARGRSKLAAAFTADGAVHGVGLVALLGALRRIGRRAGDSGSSAGASAPLMGASLAAAAGVAAMFSLHVGVPQVSEAPGTHAVQVASATAKGQLPARAPTKAAPARAVPVRSVQQPPARPVLRTQVSPGGLGGGSVAAARLLIPTPVGTLDGGGSVQQSPGGATACAVVIAAVPNAEC